MNEDLTHQRCKPCEAGIPPLTSKKMEDLLKATPHWEINAEQSVIQRKFKFKNFFRTMAFVNAVAYIASEEGHHPDLEVSYDCCIVKFTTHAIDGLSLNDFICAQKVNSLVPK